QRRGPRAYRAQPVDALPAGRRRDLDAALEAAGDDRGDPPLVSGVRLFGSWLRSTRQRAQDGDRRGVAHWRAAALQARPPLFHLSALTATAGRVAGLRPCRRSAERGQAA